MNDKGKHKSRHSMRLNHHKKDQSPVFLFIHCGKWKNKSCFWQVNIHLFFVLQAKRKA